RWYLKRPYLVAVDVDIFLAVDERDGSSRQTERIDQREHLAHRHRQRLPRRSRLRRCAQLGHAATTDVGRQSDVEVQLERPRDLFGEEPRDGAALRIRLPNQFGRIPTESQRVVAMPGPG